MKMVRGSRTAFCFWALLSLSFLVIGVSASSECTWTEWDKVADASNAMQGLADINTTEACKQWCLNNRTTCVAVQFQENSTPKCLRFDEEQTLSSTINDYQYYTYTCSTDPTSTTEPPTSTATSATSTTSASCAMQEVSNQNVTSSTPFSDTITANSDFCKTVCKWTSECTAITYKESTSTCTIHTSAVTEDDANGNIFSPKTDCDDGNRCCFGNDSSNTQGTSSSYYSLDLSDKLHSCKTACEEATSCTALTFSDDTCSLYDAASFESTDQSGSSYYSKSCTGGSLTLASICYSHGMQLQFSKLLGVLLVAVYTALL